MASPLTFSSLQYNCCGLDPEFIRAYPFHGLPNICVKKHIYININIIGDDQENSFEYHSDFISFNSVIYVWPSVCLSLLLLVQIVLRQVLHGHSVQLYELEARGLYLSRKEGGYVTKATV